MRLQNKTTSPPKHHSRIVNLMVLAAMLWGAFTLSASTELGPVEKLLVGYVSWGMMIYLLMGFFFARRPSRSIALLGGVAALGAELGHFDPTTLASLFANVPFFLLIMIPVSMACYLAGILAGWGLEILLKALWKRVSISVVHMWSGSDSGAPVEA
ncbi:MAG: hypothetical protein L3J67_01655 [Hyphomicrobiaceae bacterium]|nr:hypothetical protein [Hyphomicrobiaceae bacterium]